MKLEAMTAALFILQSAIAPFIGGYLGVRIYHWQNQRKTKR